MPKRSEEMLVDLWMSLLLVWITCAPFVSTTPIGVQSRTAQSGGSVAVAAASGLGEGQRLLSRTKRGWVWNQMFVLEEFSGRDPILVGRVSVCDCQRYIKLAYHLETLIQPVWKGQPTPHFPTSFFCFVFFPTDSGRAWCVEGWGRDTGMKAERGQGRGRRIWIKFTFMCLSFYGLEEYLWFSPVFCRKNLHYFIPSFWFATQRHVLHIFHCTRGT